MIKMLRLLAAIFVVSLQRELAFRVNLVFHLLLTAFGIASGLAALGIVYSHTQTLGGWSWAEAVVLLGTYQIVSGLFAAFVEPNLSWFGGQVRNGALDSILLRPVSSVVLASLGKCAPLALGQVLLGIVVLGNGLSLLSPAITLREVAAWLLLVAVSLTITWAARVLLACLTLWWPTVELDVVFSSVWQFGRYPVSIYRQPMRFVLTYLLPVAFISTIPARALIHGASLWLLLIALLIGLGSTIMVRLAWNAGLRRYISATS